MAGMDQDEDILCVCDIVSIMKSMEGAWIDIEVSWPLHGVQRAEPLRTAARYACGSSIGRNEIVLLPEASGPQRTQVHCRHTHAHTIALCSASALQVSSPPFLPLVAVPASACEFWLPSGPCFLDRLTRERRGAGWHKANFLLWAWRRGAFELQQLVGGRRGGVSDRKVS